jgi:hemerythrin-like metal-binding protein
MPLLSWRDDLGVGVASIDEQHKKLVNMLNALNDAVERGDADSVLAKIFEGLVLYTPKHFGYEEELIANYGYPDTEAHVKEHEALQGQALDLKAKMDAGDFMVGVEVLAFLKDWLTNHILKSDKGYSQHLVSHGVT